MISKLIYFALVFLKLFVFKFYGVIRVSKIEFFHFSSKERVKQNRKKLKTIENLNTLITFQVIPTKPEIQPFRSL